MNQPIKRWSRGAPSLTVLPTCCYSRFDRNELGEPTGLFTFKYRNEKEYSGIQALTESIELND